MGVAYVAYAWPGMGCGCRPIRSAKEAESESILFFTCSSIRAAVRVRYVRNANGASILRQVTLEANSHTFTITWWCHLGMSFGERERRYNIMDQQPTSLS